MGAALIASAAVRYETLIAFRQLRARKTRSLSVVSWLAILGVALGVMALVGGFSVTTGFEQAFREKVLGMTSHMLVREYGRHFGAYDVVSERVESVDGVVATSPMTINEAMITGRTGTSGAVVKGILPIRAAAVLDLETYMVEGALTDLKPASSGVEGMLLGSELARKLGVKSGDVVTVVSPLKSLDPEGFNSRPDTPTSRPFRVVGIFKAGFHEYDARLAYMQLGVAQHFFGSGDAIFGLEVAVDDPMRAQEIAAMVRARIGADRFRVVDWRRQNNNLFASLMYQRIAILVVLSVMVLLASCNVASMLIMLVLERTRDIAILKAMGARDRSILKIFMIEGLVLGALGTALGLCMAYALFEGLLANGVALDPKVYGIARLPVVFDPQDYLMAAVGAMVITFLATIFPALRGARFRPADGLRETLG